MLPHGAIRHQASGLCLQPPGGTVTPTNGTLLVHDTSCADVAATKFDTSTWARGSNLLHSSGVTLRPTIVDDAVVEGGTVSFQTPPGDHSFAPSAELSPPPPPRPFPLPPPPRLPSPPPPPPPTELS